MSFINKQNELLQALHGTNYDLFDGDQEEALSFLQDQFEAMPDYANVVIREQIMIPLWQSRCEPDEYRENIQSIDRSRRIAHDNAINSMNIVNRLSSNLGLEPFFDVDTNDRHAVADAVGSYVCEIYNGEIDKTFDDAALNRVQEYDSKTIAKRLNESIQNIASKFGDTQLLDNERNYS